VRLNFEPYFTHFPTPTPLQVIIAQSLTFVFRVPAAWLVVPFLLVDLFGIVQPTKSYEGKISSALPPSERHTYTNLNEIRFSIKIWHLLGGTFALIILQVLILTPRCFNFIYFSFSLETNFSRNWAHVLGARSASFQPFQLKFGENVASNLTPKLSPNYIFCVYFKEREGVFSQTSKFKVFRYSFFGTIPNFLNRLLDSLLLVRSTWNLQYLLVLDW